MRTKYYFCIAFPSSPVLRTLLHYPLEPCDHVQIGWQLARTTVTPIATSTDDNIRKPLFSYLIKCNVSIS